MKSKLYAMMLMLGAMGGAGFGRMFSRGSSQPRPRQLSTEEKEAILAKFEKAINMQNAERKAKFPKFKEFEVHGIQVVAFSQKNAHRDLTNLLGNYGLQISEPKEVKV